MSRRVGRPFKPYNPRHYSRDEVKFMYELVRKTNNVELMDKLKYNINESERIQKNYDKLKRKLFGEDKKGI